MPNTFLLLYGWMGNSESHWQTWLASELAEAGQEVFYPEFPNPDHPKLEEWMETLEEVMEGLDPKNLIVLGHSLGNTLWMHYLKKHPKIRIKKGYLVAPPLNPCDPAIDNFFPVPKITIQNPEDYLIIHSDNDPYIPKEDFEVLKKELNLPAKLIQSAGHLNPKAGYGKWKWMGNECLSL